MDSKQSVHRSVAVLIERGMPFEPVKQALWVDSIEVRLGFPLPSALRALITLYTFPAVTLGEVELFANLGDGSDDDLTVAPFRDSNLSKWLQANQRIQFARPATGGYDPVCLESRGKHSTAVEKFDHEDILLGRKKKRSTVLCPSLEELLQRAAA
jgi:hypothetical protein